MAIELGSAYGKITLDASGAKKGAGEAAQAISGVGKSTDGTNKSLATMAQSVLGPALGYVTLAGAIGGLVAIEKGAITQAAEAEAADRKLEQVLKSTGYAAGLTKNELDDLAGSLSQITTYDDEAIKGGEALLLTFTKIGKDVFPAALQSAMDLSTMMGGDLQGAIVQVGKALNDPVLGVTALRKVGVSFTEDQMKLIKTLVDENDLLGAQKIILGELSTEFGGQAAAALDTYDGKVKHLHNDWNDLLEAFGSSQIGPAGGIVDYLDQLVQTMQQLLFINMTIEKVNKSAGRTGYTTTWAAINYAKSYNEIMDGAYQQLVQLGDVTNYDVNPEIAKFNDALNSGSQAADNNASAQHYLLDSYDGLGNSVQENNVYLNAFNDSLLANADQDNAVEKATQDAQKALDDFKKSEDQAAQAAANLRLQLEQARTSWEVQWTAEEDGAARAKDSIDLLGQQLQGLGMEGSLVWEGFLAATGKISPEAIAQFVAIMAEVEKVRSYLARGLSVDLTVKMIMQDMTNMGLVEGTKTIPIIGSATGSVQVGAWTYAGTAGYGSAPNTPMYKNSITGQYSTSPTSFVPYAGANGLDMEVMYPTLFLAGEAGPEQVTITPEGRSNKSSGTTVYNFYINNPVGESSEESISQTLKNLSYLRVTD